MCGLDLTAGDTISGPPPRAPGGSAFLQVRPGLLQRSGATTQGPDPRKPRTLRTASGARTPFSPGRSPTRHVVPRRLQTGRPCRVSCGSKPSPVHQPDRRIKCEGCACRGSAWAVHCHAGRAADTTVSPPVTKAARHITVRRTVVLRRHTHGKGNHALLRVARGLRCIKGEAMARRNIITPKLVSGCRPNSGGTSCTVRR